MGTKYECDVEGCDETASKASGGRGVGPFTFPPDWCCIIKKTSDDELTARKRGMLEKMRNFGDRGPVMPVRRERFVLVCPKHSLPKFKPAPPLEDEDDVYGALLAGPD